MSRYMVKRLLNMIPILLIATLISFLIMHNAPGGPENMFLGAEQNAEVDASRLSALREKWGLNDPLPVQYYRWVKNATAGDLGYSYFQRRAVTEVIAEALPKTLELSLIVLVLTYVIAIPLGVISAVRQYSRFDYLVTGIAFVGQAAPVFWIAMLLQYGVAMHSGGLIPVSGFSSPMVDFSSYGWLSVIGDRLRFLFLPVVTATFTGLTGLTRYMRSSMLEVLKEDYTRTARAKGLPEKLVIYKHALRNALLPIVTISGGILASLVSGSVILETVFSWPGIGRVGYEAVVGRDYPVSMGILLMGTILTLLGFLLVDIAYVFVDPRIKYD
ncbi:MAG TPA: ABC transporter permease [Symbiobacteriaceae bacterium]|jgi:peptide/nickel transport system permease protein